MSSTKMKQFAERRKKQKRTDETEVLASINETSSKKMKEAVVSLNKSQLTEFGTMESSA